MAVVLSIEEAGKWISSLAKDIPNAARRGTYAAALHIQQDLMTDNSLPRDRGIYRAGWRAEPAPYGADVFNQTIQGLLIEESVRPDQVKIGKTMIQALMEWARRKHLGDTPKVTKKQHEIDFGTGKAKDVRFHRSSKRATMDELKSIAWAIAKNIKKRGLFGYPTGLRPLANVFAHRGVQYLREEIEREILRAVTK
jgi:hypothetical protein